MNHSLAFIAPACHQLHARDIRVRTDSKTLNEAIKLAEPGDTIHLEPIVDRACAGFYGKKGAPGLPIALEGHGGARPRPRRTMATSRI